MNNLNAALKDLGFSQIKMPYATDQKPADEMERLTALEQRLGIEPDEADQDEPEPQEVEPEADQEPEADDE